MGKVIEKVKLTNILDPAKSVEVEALFDPDAMMTLSLPQDIVDELGLRKMREGTVLYADGRREIKPVYAVVS